MKRSEPLRTVGIVRLTRISRQPKILIWANLGGWRSVPSVWTTLIWWQKPLGDKEWIRRSRPGGLKYVGYAIIRLLYRTFPDAFRTHFTLGGLLIWLVQIGLVALISFIPVIFAVIIAPMMGLKVGAADSPTTNPYYQAGLILVLQVAKIVLDKIKSSHAEADERLRNLQDLAVALDESIGAIERQIREFASDSASQADIYAFLQKALKCIDATVRLCTGNLDDRYCCVNLLTFEPNDKLKITARSRVERPVGHLVSQGETMAYLAAKYTSELAVIHNFRCAARFRKAKPIAYRSLTSLGKPQYESILFLPLTPVTIGNKTIRKGVVTIDAARPYEFLGKELDILIRVKAYLHVISIMLTNHTAGVEPELT